MVRYQLSAIPPGVITPFWLTLIYLDESPIEPELNLVNASISTIIYVYMETGGSILIIPGSMVSLINSLALGQT